MILASFGRAGAKQSPTKSPALGVGERGRVIPVHGHRHPCLYRGESLADSPVILVLEISRGELAVRPRGAAPLHDMKLSASAGAHDPSHRGAQRPGFGRAHFWVFAKPSARRQSQRGSQRSGFGESGGCACHRHRGDRQDRAGDQSASVLATGSPWSVETAFRALGHRPERRGASSGLKIARAAFITTRRQERKCAPTGAEVRTYTNSVCGALGRPFLPLPLVRGRVPIGWSGLRSKMCF
jgi:hypothetical protein